MHYVPVKQDLSDLKEKFDWYEAHPEQAQKISQHATDLALRLASEEYIRELYESLFVEQLGKIVDSYRPAEGETIESILAAYEAGGVPLRGYGECDAVECSWGVKFLNEAQERGRNLAEAGQIEVRKFVPVE